MLGFGIWGVSNPANKCNRRDSAFTNLIISRCGNSSEQLVLQSHPLHDQQKQQHLPQR